MTDFRTGSQMIQILELPGMTLTMINMVLENIGQKGDFHQRTRINNEKRELNVNSQTEIHKSLK